MCQTRVWSKTHKYNSKQHNANALSFKYDAVQYSSIRHDTQTWPIGAILCTWSCELIYASLTGVKSLYGEPSSLVKRPPSSFEDYVTVDCRLSVSVCLSVCLSLTSVTLTTVQGHSSVKKQFQLKISYITIKVKLCMLVNCVI